MNFLGLGPGELILIAVLGLIIFGPGRLPEIAAQVGKTIRDFRRSTSDISAEFQRSFSLEELTAPTTSASAPVSTNGTTTETADSPTEYARSESAEWHSEAAVEPAEAPAAQDDLTKTTEAPSFWDWSAPEPAVSGTAESNGSVWSWDPPASPPAAASTDTSPPLTPADQANTTPIAAAQAPAVVGQPPAAELPLAASAADGVAPDGSAAEPSRSSADGPSS